MVRMGYTDAGASVSLSTRKDRALAKDLASHESRNMFCWDVVMGQMP
jgi:hypothetical protein